VKYFSLMETESKNIKSSNNTYNPALDHLIGKELCKDKVDAARAFLKEHGLPKRFYDKGSL
jgi:protoheme ferro-lyase